jgi:hypothetical protein
VPVEMMFLYPDKSGFHGFLASMPADGDALILGYATEATTELVFHAGEVA